MTVIVHVPKVGKMAPPPTAIYLKRPPFLAFWGKFYTMSENRRKSLNCPLRCTNTKRKINQHFIYKNKEGYFVSWKINEDDIR